MSIRIQKQGIKKNSVQSSTKKWLLAILSGIILTLFGVFVSHSDVRATDKIVTFVTEEYQAVGDTFVYHCLLTQQFTNYGGKDGFISDFQIMPLGLSPLPNVQLIQLNKGRISFLTKKEIETEFILKFTLTKDPKFKGFYYDEMGAQVGWVEFGIQLSLTPFH